MPNAQSRSLIPIEVAGAALVAVVGTWILAAPGSVPAWEQTIFDAVNQLPDWLLPILWPPMQLGALVGALVIAMVFVAVRRRPCAGAYAAAASSGWLIAVAVKQIVARERPLSAGVETIIRGADASGFGFISGHTTVAFAGATVIWVFYGRRWGAVAYLLAVTVGIARMYVGAHLPLDVVGGAAVGTIIGGAVTWLETLWLMGVPTRSRDTT